MNDRPTCIERAFALAQGGKCGSLTTIREQLKAEGYSDIDQLSGNSIRAQLMKLIVANQP